MENLRVRRAGFAFRMHYKRFLQRSVRLKDFENIFLSVVACLSHSKYFPFKTFATILAIFFVRLHRNIRLDLHYLGQPLTLSKTECKECVFRERGGAIYSQWNHDTTKGQGTNKISSLLVV